jgi:hypothetical protein
MSSSATLTSLPAPSSMYGSGGKAVVGVIVFFLLWVFIWVLFFSFRPSIVRYCEEAWPYARAEGCNDLRPADPSRCLVASLIVTLIIFIIIWLIASTK